jgi:hypothetical protein
MPRNASYGAIALGTVSSRSGTVPGFMVRPHEYRLDDVYGITRQGVPRTYVAREDVDERFLNEITRDQHIVVYGSSKQGKSSLLRTALNHDDYVAIQCAIDWDKESVYRAILKEIGISVAESESQTHSGSRELKAEVKAEGGVPIFAKASGGTTVSGSRAILPTFPNEMASPEGDSDDREEG